MLSPKHRGKQGNEIWALAKGYNMEEGRGRPAAPGQVVRKLTKAVPPPARPGYGREGVKDG